MEDFAAFRLLSVILALQLAPPSNGTVSHSPVETTWDVSIRAMYNTNLVVEDRELQLKCDIVSSGPIRVQNLTVWGFRGKDSVKLAESNTSSCEGVSVGLPGNFSCTVNITLKRAHSGLQIRCEAQFEPGEQQSPQNAMSQPLNISVMYQPEINTTKLPDAIPLFRGYPEELVCEADGNPPPNITWIHSSPTAQTGSGGKLSVFDPGLYTCTAENPVNSTTYSVQVFLKEDYLPLIAGFVAVTVVAISVVFLFIYSIYYKNTKMRRYNLKNAKLSTQNGNVAHNGWDMQFPITKLS
ncbi:unnamed protein product [Menidia menidia]|uniref:(Atlantic silverside) hypothetical protein n=1 Tax=Menidia menidia TaxID=238744 RepID=A0A8S4B1B1_9TELE|nr:unnamed protein product [Menidia menidia]